MNENKQRFKKAIKLAGIKEGDSVLDLGACGNSKYSTLLDFLPKNIEYVSIDINENPIIKYDLNKGLPKHLKKFDIIFLLALLEYIPNYKKLLIDCKNHLKLNGRIIISTPTNYCFRKKANSTHCFRKQNLVNLFNQIDMDYFITGVHLRIPKLNIFIPCSQLIYNDTFLIVLTKKEKEL